MALKPLLILSDAPTAGTGLGRITRDLATRIAQNMPDTFRVATVGYGGIVSRYLPFHQYILEDCKDFVCTSLPEIWEDWAGNEKGVLLSIWDISRLAWLSEPKTQCENARLRDFLMNKPFQKWIYAPIDAEGPDGRLTYPIRQTLGGFDRVLAYGKWAAQVVDRTLDASDGTTRYLPHGIDSTIFYERNRALCRKMFISLTQACHLMGNLSERVKADELLVGIVATNQSRKDWQLAIETCAILAKTRSLRLWIKTDVMERHWSIPALLVDYGLVDCTMISLGDMKDDQMAQAYSACDVTLAPGLGEGMGYPIFESLFCGTPCIHINYGGAPEWMRNDDLLVDPDTYRYEGVWTCKRPVVTPWKFAASAEAVIGKRTNRNGDLDWTRLWPAWEQWLREGVNAT